MSLEDLKMVKQMAEMLTHFAEENSRLRSSNYTLYRAIAEYLSAEYVDTPQPGQNGHILVKALEEEAA